MLLGLREDPLEPPGFAAGLDGLRTGVEGRRATVLAIQALLAGQRIHFNGATGPLNFEPGGRVTATAYDVWQVAADKTAAISQTVTFTP